jgi:thiol-disulfide isomerase/thioredoxin
MFAALRKHVGFFLMLLAAASLASLFLPHACAQANRPKNVLDLDGKAADPFQIAAGKVVVLVFVRTDCPISNRYAPTIQAMSAHFGKGAEFFLIYPIRSETPDQIRKHLQDYGYKLTALRDPALQLVRTAQVKVTPEAAVFSPDGRLLYHGRIDDWYSDFGRSRPAPTTHELASAVEAAIAGKGISMDSVPAVGCFLPETP